MSESVFLQHDLDQHDYSRRVDYCKYYNLKQSPFEDTLQLAMYYPVPSWQGHIDILNNFCEGNRSLLLVKGEAGIGKTMLLTSFVSQLNALTTVAHIRGRSTITASQLISMLSSDLQLGLLLSQPSLYDQVQTALTTLQQTKKKCLLIIDDADLLPLETLSVLIQFALQQSEKVNLHLVLLCELDLQSQIENTAASQGNTLNPLIINLLPFKADETKGYIKHRLAKAGYTGKFLFNKEIIMKIHELSAGVPSRINRVTQQKMTDLIKSAQEQKTKPEPFSLKKMPIYIKIATISVLLLMAGVILWQEPQKLLFTEQSNLNQIQKKQVNQIQLQLPDKKPAVVKPVNPVAINPTQLRTAEVAVFDGGEPSPSALTVNNANTNPEKVHPILPTLEMVKKTTSAIQKKAVAMTGYTLQLLGSRSLTDLHRTIKIKRLAQTDIFVLQLDNRPWYVLLYGKYASAKDAKSALKEFALADIHPWVRPLGTLQEATRLDA